MKLSIELVDPTETLAVEVDGRDRRAFELLGAKALGLPAGLSLQTATQAYPENYLLWLGWHAATKRGERQDLGAWDTFTDRVAEVEPEEHAGAADDLGDPTRPAA
jgi:hypothetical protein